VRRNVGSGSREKFSPRKPFCQDGGRELLGVAGWTLEGVGFGEYSRVVGWLLLVLLPV